MTTSLIDSFYHVTFQHCMDLSLYM